MPALKEKNSNSSIKKLFCEELNPDSFKDVDFALGATENDIAKTWIPWALENNVVIVDNSSAFRLDQDVPLVIPEINPEDIAKNKGIIANPNCATIIALVALNALHKEFEDQTHDCHNISGC